MPSALLTAASGFTLISGNFYSGQGGFHPVGGIQLKYHNSGTGLAYVALSGGFTINSGGILNSGGASSGWNDAMMLAPGDTYFIPKIAFRSGSFSIFAAVDAVGSGISRLYWEPF